MEKIQSLAFWKKPSVILALILAAFFLKGVFLTALFPIFVGQDEARHYSSIQYISEPRPAFWPIIEREQTAEDTILKYNYSQESRETARAVDFDKANEDLYSTSDFTNNYDGKNEDLINNNNWHQYNEYSPPNIAKISLYHRTASLIEKNFGDQSILVRYFLARIFSVLLGALTVLLSYFIARNIGLSAKHSLIITAIVAFQPRFSIYSAAINYDILLILIFALFTLGGVLALKHGLNWKNLLLMSISIVCGILTKPTAYLLILAVCLLFSYFAYEKIKNKLKYAKYIVFCVFIFLAIFATIYIDRKFTGGFSGSENIVSSIGKYLSKSFTLGSLGLSSRTYWGALGWVNNWFLDKTTNIIWIIQLIAAAGIGVLLFSKKEKPEFLPEKKYVVFLLAMIVLLQAGIRFADWSLFHKLGQIEIGTPGRYFLPNIAAHIILVFTGLGMLLRKKGYFEKSLIFGLILMMTFMLYIIFDVIILRYYL